MTPLADRIRTLIGAEGPLTVERYMDLCLAHYYGSRDPLGLRGDFTTSPEISQMFGELLGLWAGAQAPSRAPPNRVGGLGGCGCGRGHHWLKPADAQPRKEISATARRGRPGCS